jgi:hypothetical protein
MPELADKIAAAAKSAQELRQSEESQAAARARFREALTEAHQAGASYGLLGRVVGLSRQRVARIVADQ